MQRGKKNNTRAHYGQAEVACGAHKSWPLPRLRRGGSTRQVTLRQALGTDVRSLQKTTGRTKNGLCVRCKDPSEPGLARCAKHMNERNDKRRIIKLEILTHYSKGGKPACCWPDCTITDLDMLTLDHVSDDGAKHRRETRIIGSNMYARLKREGWPPGFQTLCGGHQLKKELLRRRAAVHRGDSFP
jgi:hypothetical protein